MIKKTKPIVSLILPTHNSSRFIYECLDSIENQSFKDFELIIIDDYSTDNTRKLLKKRKYNFYVNEKRLGCTKTINKGIKMAKGRFIFRLDHDIVYDKDCLKEMLKPLKIPSAGISSCKSYYYKQNNKIRAIDIEINFLTGKTKVIGRDQVDHGQFNPKEITSMSGGNLLIKKEVLDKIGLFSEDYFLYYSDIDFCLKAKKAGFKIYLSNGKAWHKKEEKDVLSPEQKMMFKRDKEVFLRKFASFPKLALMLMKLRR